MAKAPMGWLEQEAPKWIERGWMDESSLKALLEHYGSQGGAKRSVIILSLFGFLLLGLGLILILAHNWEMMGRSERLLLSAGLLLLGQGAGIYAWKKGGENRALREGAAILWVLLVGASLALIGQTYHLGGEFRDLLWAWMLLGLLIPFLLKADGAALFLLAGITALLLEGHQEGWMEGVSWLALALFGGYYAWRYSMGREGHALALLGWGLALSLSILWAHHHYSHHAVSAIEMVWLHLLFSWILWAVGRELHQGLRLYHRPFEFIGKLGLWVVLLGALPLGGWEALSQEVIPRFLGMENPWILLMGVAYLVFVSFIWWRRKGVEGGWIFEVMPLLWALVLGIFLSFGALRAMLFFNLAAVVGAVFMILYASKKEHTSGINEGMAILLVGILIQFLDSHLGLVGKGLAFILVGGAFLLFNLRFRFKNSKESK